MQRIIYSDDDKIIQIQVYESGKIPPIIENIYFQDIEVNENEVMSNLRIENKKIKYDIEEIPKTYKELYETEIIADLMAGGVINGAISSDNK